MDSFEGENKHSNRKICAKINNEKRHCAKMDQQRNNSTYQAKKQAWKIFKLFNSAESRDRYKELETEVKNKIKNSKRGMEKKLANSKVGNSRKFAKSKTKTKISIGLLKSQDGRMIQ